MTTRRQFVMSVPAAAAAFALADNFVLDAGPARAQQIDPLQGHFHPKGKAPSEFTLEVLKKAKATLPFADERDFAEQKKGLIAPMK
ncbi:MAG: MBL fold metallo-hydrolase, partial [Methyloceanibacter sp.]|nr:MBL fold metallo-hydrolase [Methyloceanibacter sp.]